MDITQVATTFAAGAAGAYSMLRLMRFVAKADQKPMPQPRQHIWPNGDREEIINEITRLRQANMDRYREHTEILSKLESICERLDRARIM